MEALLLSVCFAAGLHESSWQIAPTGTTANLWPTPTAYEAIDTAAARSTREIGVLPAPSRGPQFAPRPGRTIKLPDGKTTSTGEPLR